MCLSSIKENFLHQPLDSHHMLLPVNDLDDLGKYVIKDIVSVSLLNIQSQSLGFIVEQKVFFLFHLVCVGCVHVVRTTEREKSITDLALVMIFQDSSFLLDD